MDIDATQIGIFQFLLIYLLLFVVLVIMKKGHIKQGKYMLEATMKMSLQLIAAGFILTYIIQDSRPLFTIAYLTVMIGYAIYIVLKQNKDLNIKFKIIAGISMAVSALVIMLYFIGVVIGKNVLDPRYAITISGMLMGNTMTGASLALKTLSDSLRGERAKINALLCIGATPKKILFPFCAQALETALLPTLNRMMGMGVVALPGMMTGQIIAGELPMTAIMYQIAIMIAICVVVTLASFGILFIGSKTLYDKEKMTISL